MADYVNSKEYKKMRMASKDDIPHTESPPLVPEESWNKEIWRQMGQPSYGTKDNPKYWDKK